MEQDMKQDPALTINWFRINVPTIAAVIAAVWFVWSQDAKQDLAIGAIETSRLERSKEADAKFAQINTAIQVMSERVEPLGNVVYRVGVVESQLIETNKRMDRFAETLVNSIEAARKDINMLTTKVEVMSQKIDASLGPQRQSRLNTLNTRRPP